MRCRKAADRKVRRDTNQTGRPAPRWASRRNRCAFRRYYSCENSFLVFQYSRNRCALIVSEVESTRLASATRLQTCVIHITLFAPNSGNLGFRRSNAAEIC
jgi:hypothetical protein